MADLTIDIFDTSTTSESSPVVTGWDVVTNDTTIPTESVGYYPDFVNTYEIVSLQVLFYLAISFVEFVAVQETIFMSPVPNIVTSDATTVTDVLTQYPDQSVVLEFVEVEVLNPFSPVLRESVITSESVSVSLNSPFGPFNPKKRISEITDPQIIRIERL